MKIFLSALLFVCSYAASIQAIRPPEDPPHPELAADYTSSTLRANKPVVNMYQAPSEQSKIISQAIHHDCFEFIEEANTGWTKVQATTIPYAIGWVKDSDLSLYRFNFLAMGFVQDLYITQKACAVYPEKSSHSKPIMILPYSARVQTANFDRDKNSNWFEIKLLGHNKPAYIRKKEITDWREFKDTLTLDEMKQFAKTLVGIPYIEGGSTTLGFDNKGLVEFLFNLMKRQPQYDSLELHQIIKLGQSKQNITHIGVWLENNKFIYAGPSTKDGFLSVCIADINDPNVRDMFPYHSWW
jgi:hypothetical protein